MATMSQHEKAAEEARTACHQSESIMCAATGKAKEAASLIGAKAEAATEAVGAGMESLGHSIRDHTPKNGVMGHAGQVVADKLESGGRYLEDHGLQHIGADVTNAIRRNPIPALLIGVGLGLILARMTRS